METVTCVYLCTGAEKIGFELFVTLLIYLQPKKNPFFDLVNQQ